MKLPGPTGSARALAFDTDQRLFASGADGTVHQWDLGQGREIRRFGGPRGEVYRLALSPDGESLAGASGEQALFRWRLVDGTAISSPTTALIRALAYSPDGALVAVASSTPAIALFPSVGGPPRFLEGHANGVLSIAFSPDAR